MFVNNKNVIYMSTWQGIIVSDTQIMMGKPIIKGTRITVELIVEKLSNGASLQELLEAYPHINEVQIRACLAF